MRRILNPIRADRSPSSSRPTSRPAPCRQTSQGDRVRMVFGLTSDDFLPAVDEDSLETYYDHLVEQMSLPVEARYCPQEDFFNPSPLRRVKVVALDREIAWDEDEGILCKIRTAEGDEVVPLTDLEFRRSDPNHQLVDDFACLVLWRLVGRSWTTKLTKTTRTWKRTTKLARTSRTFWRRRTGAMWCSCSWKSSPSPSLTAQWWGRQLR